MVAKAIDIVNITLCKSIRGIDFSPLVVWLFLTIMRGAVKINAMRSHYLKHSLVLVPVVLLLAVCGIIGTLSRPADVYAATATAPKVAFKADNSAKYSATISWAVGSYWASSPSKWIVGWGTGTTATASHSLTGTARSYDIAGLGCGVTYHFWVTAYNSSGAKLAPSGSTSGVVPCLSVVLSGFNANGTTSVTMNWSAASFASGFTAYIKTGSGTFLGTPVGAAVRSFSANASCGQTYSAYVTATDGTHAATSATLTTSTAACPPPPAPAAAAPAASAPKRVSGSSSNATVSAPPPPAAPTGLSAVVQSSKLVKLSWNASVSTVGIKQYAIDRSTDQANWQPLAPTTATNYQDEATDFGTTYYYRLRAIDNNGNLSDYATTSAITGKFQGTASRIVSDDKLVAAQIPTGAFTQSANCSIAASGMNSPAKNQQQILLIGPYDLFCVDEDGTAPDSFRKPLTLDLNLSKAAAGYTNFSVRVLNGDRWEVAKSNYNAKTHHLSFALAANKSFAAYGVRQKSAAGVIWGTVIGLFILAGLVVGVIFLRRRLLPAADNGSAAAAQQFEEAVAKPNCSHLAMAHEVLPQTDGCAECLQDHTDWKGLRICLTCGHLGCSDDSTGQHARHHFEQTGHPLIMAYGDPAVGNIGWCYIDQTYV